MEFHAPTKIVFGSGSIEQIEDILDRYFTGAVPYLVTDRGVLGAGIADEILLRLGKVKMFVEVEPNPKSTTVDRAAEEVRKLEPDMIIGLGGGSVLDAAKAIALLATNEGKISCYEGRKKYGTPPLPVLAIPTTCGTGSEVTWVSVITDVERKFKISIKGPEMFPTVALVDPDLLQTLPRSLVASTGLDALTHAVEAFTVKPATFLTDVMALESLRLIFSSLEQACRDIKRNTSAREDLMKGSLVAGLAFGNSDVGAVHCIAEAVGSLYEKPHGTVNSIFLPFVMEYNLPVSASRYARIARLWDIRETDDHQAARMLIRKIRKLSSDLDIPPFKDLGISEDGFLEIAQKSFQNNSNPSNPRDIGIEGYLEILKKAYAADLD